MHSSYLIHNVCGFKLLIMKKIFISIICILTTVLLAYSGTVHEWIFPEKTVAKNINLQISKTNNYRYKVYHNSYAMVNVTVISLHKNNIDTLITKDFTDFKLRNLSSYSKTFNQNIHVPDVSDKKQQIVVVYTIKYTSKGSTLMIPNVKYIGKGVTNDNFIIHI